MPKFQNYVCKFWNHRCEFQNHTGNLENKIELTWMYFETTWSGKITVKSTQMGDVSCPAFEFIYMLF